ncbi:acetylxylan esterase [Pseudonocardiaceae bacterium YIM PH 21723]|nr:acetylxylan esterase [Pseudonocardiaceae bacterium YIM PH 21723]
MGARMRVLSAVVVVLGALLVPITASAGPSACPSVGTNWSGPGPFAVTSEQSGVGHTVFRPTDLTTCSHPVILWGNGTGATPDNYLQLLQHLASHGFIVAAANTEQSGSGKEMLAGLDWVTGENSKPGSPYAGHVDLAHVGASGHSQGGAGTVQAGADPRVVSTVPIEPGPGGDNGKLHGSVFWLAGQFDLIVLPILLVLPRYQQSGHIPAVYGELAGATHLTPQGDGGGFRGPITAWFRYQLMGDAQARAEFVGQNCGQCGSKAWSNFQRNAKVQ